MGDYELFKKQVFGLTQIDLSCYKERQMKRRSQSARLHHTRSISDC